MNLRKILLLIVVAVILFSFSFSLYFQFDKNGKNETEKDDLSFVGYIPTKNKPIWVWEKVENGEYQKTGEIDVVFNTGHKFRVKFKNDENWPGALLVIYKDSYPPAKGKKVKVFGKYEDDDNFWIYSAEL